MRNILFLLVLLFATNSFAVSWVEQLGLKERASAPTAQANLGQVWVEQASKDLMFRDSLGVDYNILLGGGIGGAQLNDMSDVDTFTASPTVGQALTYNGSLWVPATPASSLSLLTDVALATPTNSQVLTYNSTTSKWENKNPTGKTLVGSSPVVITQDATSATFSLSYTPENVANKSTNTALGTSDTLYPTQNAVKAYVDGATPSITGTANYVSKFTGTGLTASQIFDNGTNVGVSGTFSVQSGAAAGTARFGADVNATTITDGVRKLARFTMPSFNTASPDLALFAGDFSSSGTSIITFGGVPSSASVVAATRLDFMTAATATTTGGTTHMTLNSSGFLGLGTTNPSSKLTIVGGVNGTETVTATASGSLSPNLFTVNINPASNSSAEIRALGFSSTTQGSSSLATVRGGYFEVRNTGSGTITAATGISSTGMVFPSTAQNFGLISDVVSFLSVPINSFSNTVTGTIGNARGLRVNNAGLTANQTLTSLIGVSLDALTAGTNNTYILMGQNTAPTGNFGIYNASANNNYFNGNIGVGATTATTKLYVTGDSTVTGYQYFGDPATNGSFRMYVSGGALKIEKRISGTWTAVGQFDEL